MKKLVLILLLFTINVFSQTIPTYSHDSGTRSPIWKIGLKGGAIKWENDSLLYKVLWNNQGGSVFGDSAYFVLTKNPNNLPQLITGKKYFYRSAIDTLTTRILKLQLGYLIDPLTLHWGDMIFHGSGLNSFFIFKTAPISGWEWLDTLVSRKYMRYRYESGTDPTFNFVYRSKYLANGYAKEIPYQIGSGITGFIPAPTDTNYVLTGAMKWKAVSGSGIIIDTTKLAYLAKNNTFTGINTFTEITTFKDIKFSNLGVFYLPTSDMYTGGTMFLNNSTIKYYTTTGTLYTLATTTDLSNYYTKTNLQTSGQAQVHFNNLTNKPTTLSGYGITDAAGLGLNNTFTGINTFNTINIGVGNNFNLNGNLISGSLSKIVLPSDLQGTLSGSIWFDGADLKVYSGLSTITLSKVGHSHTFSEITSKPTTLSGYGITDGVTTNTDQTTITGIKGLTKTTGSSVDLFSSTITKSLAGADANVKAGKFVASVTNNDNTTATGVYATASGGTNNYSGYFDNGILSTKNIVHRANIVTTTSSTLDVSEKTYIEWNGNANATINVFSNGIDGQVVIITNNSIDFNLTIEQNLYYGNLKLKGGTNCVLGTYDTITFIYNSTLSKWIELSRSDN